MAAPFYTPHRVPISLHPRQHLLRSVFLLFREYFISPLSVFLPLSVFDDSCASGCGDVSPCGLDPRVPGDEGCGPPSCVLPGHPCVSSGEVSVQIPHVLQLDYWSFNCDDPDTGLLSDTSFANSLSHSVCVFFPTSSRMSFTAEVFNFDEVQMICSFFYGSCFWFRI